MGDLVTQCEAWGLVRREPDPRDARARRIVFTDTGLLWLEAFRTAVAQAETEFRSQVGDAVATVVALGLEAYGSEAPGARAAVPSR
jgi:DNA-binding MarR family transcriptional regulator